MPFNTTMPYIPRGGSPGGAPCVTEVNCGGGMRQCGVNAVGGIVNPSNGELCLGGPLTFNANGICVSETQASLPTVNR